MKSVKADDIPARKGRKKGKRQIKPPRFIGADLLALLRSLPKPDAGFWDAVEEATRQES